MGQARNKETRNKHLAFIADWVDEKGLHYGDMVKIAEALGVNVSTVSRDIKSLMKRWRSNIEIKGQVAFERELFELNRIYDEAWTEYERSKLPMKSQTIYRNMDSDEPSHIQVTSKERIGDPRWMAIIIETRSKIEKLLGLNAPIAMTVKHEGSVDVNVSAEELSDDQLAKVITSGSGTGIVTPPNGTDKLH